MLCIGLIKGLITDNHFQWLIDKSRQSITFRNNVLSFLYFIRDIGPNVSSFAIIAMVVASKETLLQLFIVFVLGFILKEAARRTTAAFMQKVGKDDSWKEH
jgi:hypothetical protein